MRRDRLSRKNQNLSQRTRSRRNQTRRKSNKRQRNKRKRNTKRDIRRIRDRKLYRKNTKRRTKRSKRNQRNKMKKTMRRGGTNDSLQRWVNPRSAAYDSGGHRIRASESQARIDEVIAEDAQRRAARYPLYVMPPSVEGAAAEQVRQQEAREQNRALQAEQRGTPARLAMQARRQEAHERNQALQAEQRAAQEAVRADLAARRAQAAQAAQAAPHVGMPETVSEQEVLAPPVGSLPESAQARLPWVREAQANLQREMDALRR